jgi:cyclic beta-1,2-glucan synthetase
LVRGSEATSTGNPDLAPGKIFVLRNDLLDIREKELLLTVSRAILHSRQGTLAEQVMRIHKYDPYKPFPSQRITEMESARLQDRVEPPLSVPPLEYFNGIGGFADGGKEYVVVLEKGQRTPAPWINVIANPEFGFQVSESGAGYTWALNSRENQMTPWSNDPVLDPSGEAFYISDLDKEQIWSPTASPIRLEGASYMAKHGAGYSVFENASNGIRSTLVQFVDKEDPIKISRLFLENLADHPQRLLVTGYVEWVLGFSKTKTSPYIVTEMDAETGALFATNPLNAEFGHRVSFIDFDAAQTAWTADRSEFIGRNGNLERPAALLRRESLSGSTGAGLDPCGVLQAPLELKPGEKKEIVFFLGQAENQEKARQLIQKYRRANLETSLQTVIQNWNRLLGKVQVQTPDRAMDILLNHWLLYQTLACRFWARAAFYQAGGAFGFRDQLQDVLALAACEPTLARAHILKTAARQFPEGDVQHWWHPPTGRGVRTQISDDRLWLPYVALHYLRVTGDEGLMEELVPFIDGDPLKPGQGDSYYEPALSRDPPLSLYEHCARAVEISLKTGVHGLPLMGTGDWNDGMNQVGHEGQGESVWLGWFLHDVLTQMAPLAAKRGETERRKVWMEHAEKLKTALETNGWDGQWYRRAFFDDGSPLGSSQNSECQIDSIAQSWAVLSGAGDPQRALQAMQSVEEHLVKAQDNLILLFTPPFDHAPKNPGYIKGYLPGVRENGGQYTHAGVWVACAYAKLGMGNRAEELFSMLNPINHALTRTQVGLYKSEPYVMAADIYSVEPHVGRGGWTWYTGAAGWMYRAGVEFILGIKQRGNAPIARPQAERQDLVAPTNDNKTVGELEFDPCIPKEWNGFKVFYQYGSSFYEIQFENPNHVSKGVLRIEVDGNIVTNSKNSIMLKDDQQKHWVKVVMGV